MESNASYIKTMEAYSSLKKSNDGHMRYVQYTKEEKAKSKTQKKKKQKAEQEKRTCNQEGGRWFSSGMCEGDSCSVVEPQQPHRRTTESDLQSCELRVMELQEEIRQLTEIINLTSQRHEQPQVQKPPQIQKPQELRTKILQKKSALARIKFERGPRSEEHGMFLEKEIANLQNELARLQSKNELARSQWGHAKKIPPLHHDHYRNHHR